MPTANHRIEHDFVKAAAAGLFDDEYGLGWRESRTRIGFSLWAWDNEPWICGVSVVTH